MIKTVSNPVNTTENVPVALNRENETLSLAPAIIGTNSTSDGRLFETVEISPSSVSMCILVAHKNGDLSYSLSNLV